MKNVIAVVIVIFAFVVLFNIALDDISSFTSASTKEEIDIQDPEQMSFDVPPTMNTHHIENHVGAIVIREVHDMAIQRLAMGMEISEPMMKQIVETNMEYDVSALYSMYREKYNPKSRTWLEWIGYTRESVDTTITDMYDLYKE